VHRRQQAMASSCEAMDASHCQCRAKPFLPKRSRICTFSWESSMPLKVWPMWVIWRFFIL
jgi:hypothetical protein